MIPIAMQAPAVCSLFTFLIISGYITVLGHFGRLFCRTESSDSEIPPNHSTSCPRPIEMDEEPTRKTNFSIAFHGILE
jgi:hypothetical protein